MEYITLGIDSCSLKTSQLSRQHLLVVTYEVQNVLLQFQQHHSVPVTAAAISIHQSSTPNGNPIHRALFRTRQ